ncbi:MAG: hypothetical protein M3R21_00855, partial [Candidatus Dormibacteraeota bacterium]|nr:hypothetical protein [Candidatus Dormibacteraeota bacterium]
RRPGWVRFPSIPASFGRKDSQNDSQTRKRFSKPLVGPGLASTHMYGVLRANSDFSGCGFPDGY